MSRFVISKTVHRKDPSIEVTQHVPGTFCWVELSTPNPDASKSMLSKLFGWNPVDVPAGPDNVYTMLKLNEKNAAALCNLMSPDQHPAWSCYISVESADDAAAKVKDLGGAVYMEPFDVMDVGRMAVAADPAGVVFCLWQPKAHCGAEVVDETNAHCWTEMMTKDAAASEAFFTQLFGWRADHSMGDYTMFFQGDKGVGGMMQIGPEMGPIPSHLIPYFYVPNCDESAQLASSLGCKVCHGPEDVPGMVRFAVVMDEFGAVFGICHPLH